MITWIRNIITNLKSKQVTTKKIREAYLIRDSRYLKKAYKNGQVYMKRIVVGYLGEISNQRNFKFLIKEMKLVEDLQLKSYIFAAIMNLALNDKIEISEAESNYLNQNLNLLDNIGYVAQNTKKKKTSEPITFRDKLRDHLEILEYMKKQNEIY